MRYNGIVKGTQARRPPEVERNRNDVYVRSGIVRKSEEMDEETMEFWEYEETVLDSVEYDAMLSGILEVTTAPLRSVERMVLHNATTDDTMQALRKIRENDTTYDWQAWLDALDEYNRGIEATKGQEGYPENVIYPSYPTRD